MAKIKITPKHENVSVETEVTMNENTEIVVEDSAKTNLNYTVDDNNVLTELLEKEAERLGLDYDKPITNTQLSFLIQEAKNSIQKIDDEMCISRLLKRVVVNPAEPMEAQKKSEAFTVSNSGWLDKTITVVITYGVPMYLPVTVIESLKDRKFVQVVKEGKFYTSKTLNAFVIEYLSPLTKKQIEELRISQITRKEA